uniref:Macaca fascicularis brain cDNA, clone: QflA-20419 n=1 Tax=Macaca fascicularis TaxID=9541 RepID=I7GCU9_MACFA|nr:unnamed protein product [Macaca fascicularis]
MDGKLSSRRMRKRSILDSRTRWAFEKYRQNFSPLF